MQLAQPTSRSLSQTAVVSSADAGHSSKPNTTTPPFAALLGLHQDGQPPAPNKPAEPSPKAADPESTKGAAQAPKEEGQSQAPSNQRMIDHQPERNRLNAQREARQLANRQPAAPSNKMATPEHTPSMSSKTQPTEPTADAAAADSEDEGQAPHEPPFNPLALLQWITEQTTQPPVARDAAAPVLSVGAANDNDDGDADIHATTETAASAGVASIFSTIKTSPDAAVTGLPHPFADKTPSGRPTLTGKIPAAGLSTPPSTDVSAARDETEQTNSHSPALGPGLTPQMGNMGLEGWVQAIGSATAPTPSGTPGAVQKPAPSATFEINSTATQPFALSPGQHSLGDSAAVSVNLPAPVQSPEFRELLGNQISLLAKDGVQAAELHLNPAEMGPVSVQITLDGTQARVDFGADSAQTRQFIEASLPELASALRDAGLTLSGGGVSQHARGRGDQPSAGGSDTSGNQAEGGRPTDSTTPPSVSTRRVALGGVDLYA